MIDWLAVLVTGGAGYIGSHICLELIECGCDIVVVDNFSNSKFEALRRVMEMGNQSFPVYNLDLHNQKELSTIFDRHSIDAVIHLAGYKSVRDSTIDPINYYWNNIVSTLTLLEVMQMQDVYKLVFSSSATVYKASDKMPITEDHPLEACNPYGRTKLIIEQLLKDVHDSDPNWHIVLGCLSLPEICRIPFKLC